MHNPKKRLLVFLLGAALTTTGVAVAAPVAPDVNVAAAASPSPPSAYSPTVATRALDTREQGGPFTPGEVRTVSLLAAGVPATATAVTMNVTMTETGGPGFVTVWPSGQPRPATSSLNSTDANRTVSNLVTVPVSAGAVDVFSLGDTHVIIDILGAYTPAPNPVSAGRYRSTSGGPARVYDSRTSGGRFNPSETRPVDLTSVGVPADASAAVVTVTATAADGAGYVTLWPSGTARPWISNLNVDHPNQTVSNQAIVPLTAGHINVFSMGRTHIVIDVVGWMTGKSSPAGLEGRFVAVQPYRVTDTRTPAGGGRLTADSVASIRPLAQGAAAAVVNVTFTGSAGPGFLTAFAAGTGRPPVSALTVDGADQTVATHVISELSATGLSFYTMVAGDLIVDAVGYFTAGEQVATGPVVPPPTTPPVRVPPATATPGTTSPATASTTTPPATTGTTTTPTSTTPPATTGTRPGASLPIRYTLNPATTKLFVSTNGSDTNPGSIEAPLASITAAINRAATGKATTIVVRGGTYRQGNITVPATKTINIVAYPNETPTFTGSRAVGNGAWQREGAVAFIDYDPQPITDGSGISFITGMNLAPGAIGNQADQAWTPDRQLRQVATKTAVTAGTFYVDRATHRMYLPADDIAQVEVSDRTQFIAINGAGSSIDGIRIVRYSNSAADYGTIRIGQTAHGTRLSNVEIIDSAFQAIQYAGGNSAATILKGATLDHVTITGPGWMGVAAVFVDNLTLRSVNISRANPFGEFISSPQSGALKTSRVMAVTVQDSYITDNNSNGLWFDQSTSNVDVIGNTMSGNSGAAVFFEISDDLLLANNKITATGNARAVKIAGGSGVKVVNNTFIGGADPFGVFTDSRSMPGCADQSQPLCPGSFASDRDSTRPRPATMDWMPRLDLVINNIFAYPTSAGFCGGLTAMCITQNNATARTGVDTVIHQADPARGIPRTIIDGNVYAVTGDQAAVRTSKSAYPTHSSFGQAMSAAPVGVAGIETRGLTGQLVNPDGTPTAQLLAMAGSALEVPAELGLNAWLPANTRRFGANL